MDSQTVIAIPSSNMVHAAFAISLASLAQRHPDVSLINGWCCNLPALRQELVDSAIKCFPPDGPDYLLFLDSDMAFPADTLSRLLAHGKDIAGATYRRGGKQFDLMGSTLDGYKFNLGSEERLVQARRMPTGVLLISMRVFKTIPRPFFNYHIDEKGVFGSEDFWFCDLAREHGFEIWCDLDLTLECSHLKEYALHGGHSPQILKLAIY